MKKIYLVTHPEASHSVDKKVGGWYDRHLTDCGVGCHLESPSTSQNIHGLSGLVLFFSLLLSSLLWVFLSKRCLGIKWFAWFSLLCSLVAIALLPFMAEALESGVGFGLYQRLSYGSQALWVLVFSVVLLRLNVPAK